MIKNIIFDLGNVLFNYKPEELLSKYTNDLDRINKFLTNVTRSDTWWQLDRGVISLEKAKTFFFEKYPDEKDLLVPFFNHWMDMLTPIKDNVMILRELKKNGYKIYILSNFIKEAFEHVKNKNDFFSLSDGWIISGQEKVIKPEKAIYEILIRRYNLIPEDCVFIDDVPGFLRPAKKLGMKTIWFHSKTDLRAELTKLEIKT